jgi:hypothetical protein
MERTFSLDTIKSIIKNGNSNAFYEYFHSHEEAESPIIKGWALFYLLTCSQNEDRSRDDLFHLMIRIIGIELINHTIQGLLPLQIAYKANNLKYFHFMLLNGADPEIFNEQGVSTYEMIIRDENEKFLAFVLKYETVIYEELIKNKS